MSSPDTTHDHTTSPEPRGAAATLNATVVDTTTATREYPSHPIVEPPTEGYPLLDSPARVLDCIEPVVIHPTGAYMQGHRFRFVGGRVRVLPWCADAPAEFTARGLFWDGVTSILLDCDPLFRPAVAHFLESLSLEVSHPVLTLLLSRMARELESEPGDRYYEDIKDPERAQRDHAA